MTRQSKYKTNVSVGLSNRTAMIIQAEADRIGITFSDNVRRITDHWADTIPPKPQPAPQPVLILDREKGSLRAAR